MLVTGGIARASIDLFAREGASFLLVDIDAEAGERVAARFRTGGGQALFVHTDLTDAVSVAAPVEQGCRSWTASTPHCSSSPTRHRA